MLAAAAFLLSAILIGLSYLLCECIGNLPKHDVQTTVAIMRDQTQGQGTASEQSSRITARFPAMR